MKTKTEIQQSLVETRLRQVISNLHGQALEVWVRDSLCGTSGMSSSLMWARQDAAALRAKADEIEARAISRLIDDISAEWSPKEIYDACDKASKP